MLTPEILETLRSYTANLSRSVTLVLQTGEHPKRAELLNFLQQLVSVSDKLDLVEKDTAGALRSALSFGLDVDGEASGIEFSGIPGGHEFNSLILAVLQAGGTELKLDAGLQAMIANIQEPMHFEVFISLSCHNCPEVVQALNQFALVNPNIRSEMIDGGLYPEVIEARGIQGVPSVYLNGELFASGKSDPASLMDKLLERDPSLRETKVGKTLPLQDVTVVGGGPAGVAAAIYSARKGLKVTVIADRFGGQVKDTMGIENLISVPSTSGPELAGALHTHLNEYDVTLKDGVRVAEVKKGNTKTVVLSSGEEIETRTLIIATGAKWRELGVPGEKENVGNGVAYCPHCDGPFFKGKDVAVIGGGNSGIEAALDLAGIVKSVTVYEFAPALKADQVLIEKAEQAENITILKSVATQEVIAENGKVVALAYQDRDTQELKRQELDGIFVQIGLVPNSSFIEGVVELSKHGEIVVDERGQTSEDGIFACGDVTTVPYKQIIIAMGEGAKASLAAFDYLLKN